MTSSPQERLLNHLLRIPRVSQKMIFICNSTSLQMVNISNHKAGNSCIYPSLTHNSDNTQEPPSCIPEKKEEKKERKRDFKSSKGQMVRSSLLCGCAWHFFLVIFFSTVCLFSPFFLATSKRLTLRIQRAKQGEGDGAVQRIQAKEKKNRVFEYRWRVLGPFLRWRGSEELLSPRITLVLILCGISGRNRLSTTPRLDLNSLDVCLPVKPQTLWFSLDIS